MINTAITAAVAAGKKILEIYNDPAAGLSVEWKADNSPLTIADKTSHRMIMQHLEKTGWPVLSEEGKSIPYEVRRKWKTFWLVDPLDGTKEFIKRNGEFTVNIALIHNDHPVAGVIYLPVTGDLYVGVPDEIRCLNGSQLNNEIGETGAWKVPGMKEEEITYSEIVKCGHRLPCATLPEGFTVAGSRSHKSVETQKYIDAKVKEHGDIHVISKGSSLKICLVAEGLAHEYPRFGPTTEWDTAAGHAVAKAAGKNVWLTGFSGELTYNKENLLNPFFIVR
ncbi:MAG TPA: 3'(2'),5'-bisphosphate nucleotidase CysQ [Mariniphaga anaerophila]|uniref:3'(2'),5'-bisphosphate nucleotidase CysQ n=1 Tax=Mariniphaga anaerophila TaxID=1484053 RepID=A0A831LNN3_9BACT|nr:3'(2'),5'-bisphosphate nucleotidase CysQ [Mariniphaga anaerophila]